MRTLIVSDLHLGAGRRRAVLQAPAAQERLLAALDGVSRLVLLGDVIELVSRPTSRGLAAAEPVLRAVGQRLGRDAEVVFVPGNHDRPLIVRWLRRRREPLGVDTAVPCDASAELQRVAAWLWPARVRVHYPGAWLGEDVWATHGHYLDRHLFPESTYGVTRGLLGRPPRGEADPDEYETGGQGRLARVQSLLPAPLRWPARQLLNLARAATVPVSPGDLLSPRLAPLTAPLLSFQMRHASVPALAHVTHRLGVQARYVIFGHVHRLGPLAGDEESVWRDPSGTMAMLNSGSWLYEPLLVHRASPPHPYWPGGAVVLDAGQPPRAAGLLDDLSAAELRRSGRHGAGPRTGRDGARPRLGRHGSGRR